MGNIRNYSNRIVVVLLLFFVTGCASQQAMYRCATATDCVSTCGEGCVNKDWAESYEDTCVNIRAWDCACVENKCYTDGKAPTKTNK